MFDRNFHRDYFSIAIVATLVLSSSEIFNLDVDMAGLYRRAMDVQGRKCATRDVSKIFLGLARIKDYSSHYSTI
jgi:hypothetical protein